MSDPVRVHCEDQTATLSLNRPERSNALSLALLARLGEALDQDVPGDSAAVIIRGAGGVFSAGADLADLTGTGEDVAIDAAIAAVTQRIRALAVPVIAAIDGPCMGGAVELALSCDLRIAGRDAFFEVPATRLGLVYDPESLRHMRRRLPFDALFRLMVLGERLDAREARRAGLVSALADGKSHELAQRLASTAAANVRSAMTATKQLLHALDEEGFDPEAWQRLRREMLDSAERRAAVSAARKRHGL
ncbi:MAG: hypothetical protein GTN86_07835 [Xanthomonadales bacterium]|nr:hypothetical protein [Xanthomonadales bacterium]NIN59780.1 hypothetical protein [Xanthomonadales bacterium]NIN75155.1 hypothetical protein [Xanthomonadales bacterium]NIO12741.1 hypothetical protein [Xanthomonadales bacterium]NIP12173.1 hypothetical protein [Xanthomonadales bacterium]